jgi:hypothetical protein
VLVLIEMSVKSGAPGGARDCACSSSFHCAHLATSKAEYIYKKTEQC